MAKPAKYRTRHRITIERIDSYHEPNGSNGHDNESEVTEKIYEQVVEQSFDIIGVVRELNPPVS